MKIVRLILHSVAFLPLLWLAYELFLNQGQYFGADPVKELVHFLGWMAITLFLSLFIFRIVISWFKLSMLNRYHSILGLWAIIWASLHIMAYFYLELGLDMSLFLNELIHRPYLFLGALSFILFAFSALIMHSIIKQRLKRHVFYIHQLSYIALFFVVLHYVWSVKSVQIDALIYLGLGCIVILLRLSRSYLEYK